MDSLSGKIAIGKQDGLIIVDMQEDFMDGGSLEVTGSRGLINGINGLVRLFLQKGGSLVFTRDWHPENHCSFKQEGGKWPVHCVAGSKGASFAKGLLVPEGAIKVSKATQPDEEAYSAFSQTPLLELLNSKGVKRLFVVGVATEFCVLETVLDAIRLGFEVVVIVDCINPVNGKNGERALKRMKEAGAFMTESRQLR